MTQATAMMSEVPPLACEALPGFADGAIHGRLMARKVEATRCMVIMTSEEGRRRPNAAWALLPYGLGIEDTIDALNRRPIEAVALDTRCDSMVILRERYMLACAELAQFEAGQGVASH